jgi:hypothetical protein
MFLEINKKDLFENTLVAFNFEFYSPLKKNELAAKFARNLGKKVKWFANVNETMQPSIEIFKLAPTLSSKFNSVSLSTGLIPYHEAVHIMLRTMNIINDVGFALDTNRVICKIELNEEELRIPNLKNLNILKYLVGINEEKLFETWDPEKKYKRNRLAFIHPKNPFTTVLKTHMMEKINYMELSFPESDFFATDFSELGEGKLITSYIGGKDYFLKKEEAVSTLNSIIEGLYSALSNSSEYSVSESRKIEEMFSKYEKAIESTKNVTNFRRAFPEIDIYVDLRSDKYLIESTYSLIRNDLFKLVAYGNFSKGSVNYDKSRGVLQIKNAKIDRGILIENIEFFDCVLTIDAKNCLFDSCTLEESKLTGCRLHTSNRVNDSKVIECSYTTSSNLIENSFLSNSQKVVMKGSFDKCLVIGGNFSIDATVDTSCKFVSE